MAETNNSLTKYRDVLENIINATMDHVDQAATLGTAGMCGCANCRPVDCSLFNQLRGTFRRLDFEFPSQSYPEYTADTARTAPVTTSERPASCGQVSPGHASWMNLQQPPFDFLQCSPMSFPRAAAGHEMDTNNFLFPDLRDLSGIDAGPMDPCSGIDLLMPHATQELLPKGAGERSAVD